MKYMGSKRWMLQNDLGTLLLSECAKARRFVDLFAGSGAVSCFVAEKTPLPVLATDLQEFSAILTNAVICRDKPLDADRVWKNWYKNAQASFPTLRIPGFRSLTKSEVEDCRFWCVRQKHFPITQAYGGHYFSPKQAIWIDTLRRTLPGRAPFRTVALAALILAASKCVASPGHTAQPFQPTRTAKRFLREAWARDVLHYAHQSLCTISPQYAIVKGIAKVADANDTAKELNADDLVFIDPPYSGVQYSRFYHVLETIAKGNALAVSGTGRYPARSLRPQSRYSLISHSKQTLQELLETISNNNTRAILTFPEHECSNGLSGLLIVEEARRYFHVTVKPVQSRFSTLGGNNNRSSGRDARQFAKELIIRMSPRI